MEESANASPAERATCASCGAKLKGDYCCKCGEKKLVPERDFSISKFLNQTLWHFIHFDSKFLRSCWLLFSQPGFLTAEWIAGRRVGYMKPFQLFFVASVLFYFFLPTTTAHFTGIRDLTKGYEEQHFWMNTFQYDAEKAMAQKAAALQLDEATLEKDITETAARKSKTWLFLLIPCWGAWIYLFFRRNIPWLVPHLMFALHGLTFYILADLSIHAMLALAGSIDAGKYIFLALLGLFSIYQLLAVRRVYGVSWPVALLKTIALAAGFIVLILLYRQVMTIWAIASL